MLQSRPLSPLQDVNIRDLSEEEQDPGFEDFASTYACDLHNSSLPDVVISSDGQFALGMALRLLGWRSSPVGSEHRYHDPPFRLAL
ncbi:hypothetical protein CYMTET_22739 [Cymbomonas tetramitiformis]|uniref:Uncharacterized protein n=1 Tax=Cymbomonas tetramitiformis TaxID=36881 RepID=A0AAE0L1W9_9CHLO|nr:hypothetical protein CYMTET_22739 [Cymbomonas tetramitiformis]